MPYAPKRHVPAFAERARQASQKAKREQDAKTYDTAWRKLRGRFITANPLCAHCLAKDLVTAGEHVDHIIPVQKAPWLRLEPSNLQTLCITCHSIKTRQENN